jgi:hypothetical protein
MKRKRASSNNDENPMCSLCNGTGEGFASGTTCGRCGGSGEDKSEPDYDGPEPDYEGMGRYPCAP